MPLCIYIVLVEARKMGQHAWSDFLNIWDTALSARGRPRKNATFDNSCQLLNRILFAPANACLSTQRLYGSCARQDDIWRSIVRFVSSIR
jgi:hypothetical protein